MRKYTLLIYLWYIRKHPYWPLVGRISPVNVTKSAIFWIENLKCDGYTEDAMQLLRLRKKKSASISLLLLITLRPIFVSWEAFFPSKLCIYFVILLRNTCLTLKALSLWISNTETTLGWFLNLSIIFRTRY